MKYTLIATLTSLGMLLLPTPSYGQDLIYEPVNPSFGGNSFNSAHLLAIANAQNDFDPPEEESV